MDELRVSPVAISVSHLRMLFDLSVPSSYALADKLGAFTVPGTKTAKRVLLSRVREFMGDAVADDITAKLTRTLPASAGPVLVGDSGPGAGGEGAGGERAQGQMAGDQPG